MALMTLPEYAKGLEKGNIARPIVEIFAASSDIAEVLPFDGFQGAAYEYYRESQLTTGMAFRGINEPPTSGLGKIEPFQEPSFPIDHNLDVDIAITRRHGMDRRSREERLSMAKLGRLFATTFMSGDNTTEQREFNGIQKRIALKAADRLINNSTASGGAALSLAKVDQLLNMVNGATHLIAPRNSIPLFIGAARNTAVAGFVMQTWDGVGMPKMSYAGRRILFGYEREIEGDLLDFNEVGNGGGSAVTGSMYAVKMGEEGLHGVQLMSIDVQDKGLLEDGITYRTHVAWDVGLVDEHPYCIARLTSFTNAAIVA